MLLKLFHRYHYDTYICTKMYYQQILASLRAKYPGMQTSLLERVAKALSKTVTEEANIQSAVDASGELITEMADFVQKEGDRRANEAVQKHKSGEGVDPTKSSSKEGDDMPAWAKSLVETNKALAEKLTTFETQNVAKSQGEKLSKLLTDKKVPEKYFSKIISGKTFKDDAELEAFATEIETGWGEFQQHLADEGLASVPKPVFGGANKEGVSADVQNYITGRTSEKASDLGGKKI